MNYALIENGIVANVIWLHPMNSSDFPNAVPYGSLPVAIGDEYHDGIFWREGKEVTTGNPQTNDEEKADMEAALNELGVQVDG